MHAEKFIISATTDGSGNATVYSPPFTGRILSIGYTKPVSVSFTDGVDFACTLEATGQNVWTEANVNASAVRAPGQATHGQDGVAVSGVNDYILGVRDRLKIEITNGGSAKNGSFFVVVG